MDFVFKKMLQYGTDGMEMHDPLLIAFTIDLFSNKSQAYTSEFADLRVENQGIYTRGMAIVDRRREKYNQKEIFFDIWNSSNANNVEIVTFYDFKSFLSNLFKTIFNIDYSETKNK